MKNKLLQGNKIPQNFLFLHSIEVTTVLWVFICLLLLLSLSVGHLVICHLPLQCHSSTTFIYKMEERAYTVLRTCGGIVIKRLRFDILNGSKRSYWSLIQGAIDIRNQVM